MRGHRCKYPFKNALTRTYIQNISAACIITFLYRLFTFNVSITIPRAVQYCFCSTFCKYISGAWLLSVLRQQFCCFLLVLCSLLLPLYEEFRIFLMKFNVPCLVDNQLHWEEPVAFLIVYVRVFSFFSFCLCQSNVCNSMG